MPSLIRSTWRWLFPRLQRVLPAHHGHPLLSSLDRLATVFHSLYENTNYDPASNGEAWLLHQLASQHPRVIFDVGANRGDYSQLAIQACGEARIVAFEPIPQVFERLAAVLTDQPRAEAYPVALADYCGEIILFFDPDNTGNTSAVADVQESVHAVYDPQPVTVKAQTVDAFCDAHGIGRIDLLKVDVEGFESSVLTGASSLISNGQVVCIQLEYGKANLFSRVFIRDYMHLYGDRYVLGKLYPTGVKWFATYTADLDDLMGPNLVMVLRERADLVALLAAPRSPLPA